MNQWDAPKFKDWLSKNGAELLMPTNPYELVRFIAHGGTHVIYVNNKGRISASGFSVQAMQAFDEGKPLDMGFSKTQRTPNANKKAALLKRDGRDCFYCGKPMADDDITVEHLIALAKGGNNRLENMALCHEACNRKVGSLSLTHKLKLRDQMRRYA